MRTLGRHSLAVLCFVFLFAFSTIAGAGTPANIQPSPERRISFNDGWLFLKAPAEGAEKPDFDDSHWQEIRLPHDWAIEGPFDPSLNPHTGALPISGTGWYRKSFSLSNDLKGRFFTIEFDGAMSNARVWINGEDLGVRPYGYSSFAFDLTPHLRFDGQKNVLAVRLSPEDHSSRWYPGAGIYRNVWLTITGPVHVAHWGTYVTTSDAANGSANITVKTEIRNHLTQASSVKLRTSVLDESGRHITQADTNGSIPSDGTQAFRTNLTIAKPQRWDIDHPYLYTLVSEVIDHDHVVDRYLTLFGVRTIKFDKQQGFLLNGRKVKLHGVCLHHDLGALGAAVNRRATERQLQIMKAGGVNAVRTSHNPPSPELLEFADRLGLVVMDEAFDMWRIAKVPNGYSKYYDEWSERDLRDMVRRDRNHPSIILWSIGNEIPEQGQSDGWQEARRLTGFFHQEDPTRPTTSAFNQWQSAIRNKLADEVDIPGFNYQPMHYGEIMNDHPNWIIFGSETASCVSSRGTYHLPLEKYEKHESHQISSYDIIAPRWAYCPDVEFTYQDKYPNVLGEFVWTGSDYIGEPTPYFDRRATEQDWPARSSYFGMVDLAGFPKDRYYLYQSVWTNKPMVHVLPHWNWEDRAGQNIPVMVYTNQEEAELFLNGKSLGRKKRFTEPFDIPVGANVSADGKFTTKYRLLWQVPFQPGTLKVVAYHDGKQSAVEEVKTAGAPAKIKLIPDRSAIQADGDDLSFITVQIEDKDGNLCPTASNIVQFNLSGPASIAGVDNGNAATVEPFHADHRQTFNGLALLIVRSRSGQPGTIHVVASSESLAEGTVDIVTQASEPASRRSTSAN
ncbi:MAG TPA: beta-galactosidase GalB [Terriglobales bacterium]|nr:beta-galactosidase GalB [Terriglobales bacterium]